MLLKHIPKKKVLLFAGDLFFISQALLIAPKIVLWLSPGNNQELGRWVNNILIYVAYIAMFYLIDIYDVDLRFKSAKYTFSYIIANITASLVLIFVYYFIPSIQSGRATFLTNFIFIFVFCYGWRISFELLLKRYLSRKQNILIVGAGRAGKELYKIIKNYPHYHVVGFIDDDPAKWGTSNSPIVLGGSSLLVNYAYLGNIDAIVIAITHLKGPELLKGALELKLKKVQVYDMPSFYEKVVGKIPAKHVDDFWFVSTAISGLEKSIYNIKLKRILDFIISVLVIIASIPIIITTAILIKLETYGPVMHKQLRVGFKGKSFVLYKFRSMKVGTERDRKSAGLTNDPRITNIGKIIRKLRIDEIPQILNVFKGDMSIIGPRALIEEEVNEFKIKIPYFDLRHSVRPGITGWAQVNYKHGVTVEDGLEKLQYDLFYIKNLSVMLDFHILLKTIKVVIYGKGAR